MPINYTIGHETGHITDICSLFPALCGGSNQQNVPVRVNTLPNGTPQVSVGGTTLDKLLAALTTNLALIKGANYIPTTQQPQQQQYYAQNPYAVNPYADNNTGGKLGAGLETFITENTGVLLIAGIGVVLLMSGRKK